MSSTASAKDPRPLPPSDLKQTLEQQVKAGFTPELALELVLNEVVVRAAEATHASGAAIAMVRGDEMVIRASTGFRAPDLGLPIDTRDGLTGACLRTRLPQLSNDTESDPRIDAGVARELGMRSMVVVPVFEASGDRKVINARPEIMGLLEVFSPLANSFNFSAEVVAEKFARDAAALARASRDLHEDSAAKTTTPSVPLPSFLPIGSGEVLPADTGVDPLAEIFSQPNQGRPRPRYEGWTIALATLLILAAVGMGFLIEARTGWLRSPVSPPVAAHPEIPPPPVIEEPPSTQAATAAPGKHKEKEKEKRAAREHDQNPTESSDDLVVYDKDRVVFRIKPGRRGSNRLTVEGAAESGQRAATTEGANRAQDRSDSAVVAASSKSRVSETSAVWLAPDEAEGRLLRRAEPKYPVDAMEANRSGEVVLEVDVAEDGSVSSVRTLSGDALLAAAATDAVRSWRYQPYQTHGQPAPFQTDVTLTFAPPH